MISQYLERYAEAEARTLLDASIEGTWEQVLVIPAYRETPAFLQRLPPQSSLLVIVVLNRPDNDDDASCNTSLREFIEGCPVVATFPDCQAGLFDLAPGIQVLMTERPRPLPSNEGVGLARKLGCDLALALIHRGKIRTSWIHCTDADATLPDKYFEAITHHESAVALTYPYQHSLPAEGRERAAMKIYERYLHHYVDGLRAAGSPYGFHTLGSCIACRADAYAQARGFPRRAGGEDFYLLNKLAKLGDVVTPNTDLIRLSARNSSRVPFGTGPALGRLLAGDDPARTPLFYHPDCFTALKVFLDAVMALDFPEAGYHELMAALEQQRDITGIVQNQKLVQFFDHAARQCTNRDAFLRQFHQWFDGFRTLKFIRAVGSIRGPVSIDRIDTQWQSWSPDADSLEG